MGKLRVLGSICAGIICILAFRTTGSDAVLPALQQTVPPGDVAVCPLSTVQYTCMAQTRMSWRELGSDKTATYTALPPASQINDTSMAGVFRTVLTDISGTILTSTATIDSVNLTDDGRNISCFDINGATNKLVQVEGVPLAPINLNITTVLSRGDNTLTVNLTWFLNKSHCVVMYYVEVTTINITSHITNMTVTSQHITQALQIGVVYSFRVRGADSINRLGEWSDSFIFPSAPLSPSNLNIIELSKENNTLTVNLTWSQDNSDYVEIYYVEVTAATNTTSITNTTSQYIILPLQIGVVYSFRVRGADSINRLGEWSASVIYPLDAPPAPSNLNAIVLSRGDKLNLTWSQSDSYYVVLYYVEVTAATNTTSITNTTSQYIVLPIGVVYSFRVRGVDSINRLGEWSDFYHLPTNTNNSSIAIGLIAGSIIIIGGIIIGAIAVMIYCKKHHHHNGERARLLEPGRQPHQPQPDAEEQQVDAEEQQIDAEREQQVDAEEQQIDAEREQQIDAEREQQVDAEREQQEIEYHPGDDDSDQNDNE